MVLIDFHLALNPMDSIYKIYPTSRDWPQ